ncbi:DUF2057 family protein [Ferrimonas marina]|uniref:DUF2057 domain-containing protein n=1 Tax=Ferrimonas marina TaxID=299255 RepID=A0A1M5ZA68_9GAMM|nr:DUF2057 family protein [Ferrimonas marina]SHI21099.1 hypothetical protein SAMN02745129_0081 [Ferrimonas marina]
MQKALLAATLLALTSPLSAATLTLPEGATPLAINGLPIKDAEQTLTFAEGKQVLSLRYEQSFRPLFTPNLYSTPTWLVKLSLEPGQSYQLELDAPEQAKQWQAFMQAPGMVVVDSEGNRQPVEPKTVEQWLVELL